MVNRFSKYFYPVALCVFIALLAAYSNHFYNTFHFDDGHTIVDNTAIRSLKNIPRFFTDPSLFSADPGHYGMRPLLTTTFAIDYWLAGGLNPFYFQLDSFLWHIGVCLLVFGITRRLFAFTFNANASRWLALVAAGWYGLHTANAETVNYIIARSDVLSTFCIALSFYLYIAYPEKRRYLLYVVPAAFGVFAKETVPVLLIILFFYRLLFEADDARLFLLRAFNIILQLLPAALVITVVQVYALSHTTGLHGATNPWGWYVLTQPYVWRSYFYSFFLPVHLSADTDWKVISLFSDERIWKGLIFILFLILSLRFTWRWPKTRPMAFGIIWFVAALLPTSLVPFAEVMNDHRMYFPFIGLVIAVVCCLGILLVRWQARFKYANVSGVLLISLVLILNGFGVYQRNKVWHTEESLWYDVTLKSPKNGRGLMNYGLTQMSKGRYNVARRYFDGALKLLPYYSTLYINIGILNGATGKQTEADQNFKTAIAYGADSFEPYAFYARYLAQQRRNSEAKTMAQKALALNPSSAMAQQILKQTNSSQHPQTAEEWLDVSLAYFQSGRYADCIQACREALKLKPTYAGAWNNIGACYNQRKQWKQAIGALEKALSIDPEYKLAKANLEWARKGSLNPDLRD